MTRRILLVDDDDGIRTVAQISLEGLGGYTVLPFSSGEEALREGPAFKPDLLLLDAAMPGMDGPSTLSGWRAHPATKNVPAVFITANTQAAQVNFFRALGAVDVIAKPFNPQTLCDRVGAVFAEKAAPLKQSGRRRVLIIEDDHGIRYLLRFILEQKGWEVCEAADGSDAVAILAQKPSDAVVLDVMLPGMDGIMLLERLRRNGRWAHVPVLMLTAKGDEASVMRALKSGANDYLVKPFDPQDLVARLDRLRRFSWGS